MSTLNRLQKEFTELKKNPIQNYEISLIDEDNFYKWSATLFGPDNSPYEDGKFKLIFNFPTDYPFKPPRVVFETKIYHCNINTAGGICLDILKDKWSPALTVNKILLSISSLLDDQNPNDPLMPEIANIYINNKEQFFENAKKFTNLYAK